MIAEIIAIGNEVVDGSVVNTNAAYLAQMLSRFGITSRFHTTIPDEESLMREAFATAQGRAQFVLVTGGLGPTVDDFTLEIAAQFFGQALVLHQPSLTRIQNFFERLHRKITPNQERQAMVPQGSTVLENQAGTAPGIYYLHQKVHWAFFPGVPLELEKMFEGPFRPILEGFSERSEVRLMKVLRCFGLPEGEMDDRLRSELQGRLGLMGTELGFRVRFPTIDIRLTARAREATAAFKALGEAEALVRQRLGECIFGEGEAKLEEEVGKLLQEKKLTVATAESCTGGLLASRITDIPGASEYFIEGIVCYSNQSKIERLGVQAQTLEKFGAVSRETALEMARGIQTRTSANIGIAVTGIAGPSGGTPEKPVGTVHLAIVHPQGEWEQRFLFPFGRSRFKEIVVGTALNQVRKILGYRNN